MGRQKTVEDYEQEIAELRQELADAINREQQLSNELQVKEAEVRRAKSDTDAKHQEILDQTRKLREEERELKKQHKERFRELSELRAEQKEVRRLQSSIPRRIQHREERIEELRKEQGYTPPKNEPTCEENIKPTGLQDLAAVMEEARSD